MNWENINSDISKEELLNLSKKYINDNSKLDFSDWVEQYYSDLYQQYVEAS
jgi:hypothetical protein